VKYGDGGSSITLAGPPGVLAGVRVTATALPLSDAAEEGARKAADSDFCS
jgi:hypothetical protein